MTLFVYGTLLAGMIRHDSLAGTLRSGPASIHGTLRDLGSYPGLEGGEDVVIGELHQVDSDVIRRVDQVEGFDPNAPHESLFVRKEVTARRFSDGTHAQAVTYLYNRQPGRAAVIAHGDYRRHKAEPRNGQIPVVAYGSNLSSERLARRMGWKERGTIEEKRASAQAGCLEGFRLTFNKAPKSGGPPYANIEYVGGESRCPAVAWLLSAWEVCHLDDCEGASGDDGTFHYYRVGLPFVTTTGSLVYHLYIANPDWVRQPAPPGADYLDHIRKGYREFGLDGRHLQEAEARAKHPASGE